MNNKTFVLIISVLALIMTASFATALSFEGDGTLNFGSSTQERGKTVTKTFTITNTGNAIDSGITITKNGIDSRYGLNFTNIPSSIEPNSSAVITATLYIPLDQADEKTKIGSYTVRSGTQSITADVNLETQNSLKISDAVAYVGDAEDSFDIDDRDPDEVDVKPGDSVRIELKIKNVGPNDVDFDDVDVSIDSSGDVDVSEDDSISGLDEGKSHTFNFKFTVPEDAESDDTATIRVTAVDENGVTHEKEWDFDFNVDRPSHDIQITGVELNPDSISCTNGINSANKVVVTVNLKNNGRTDEDEVTLEVKSRDLNYFKRAINLQIDENRKISKTFEIPVPAGTASGEYMIEVTSYYNNNDLSDTQAESFSLKACTVTTPVVVKNDTIVTTPVGNANTPSTIQNPFVSTPHLGETSTKSLISSDTMYIIILGLVALLLIVAIIVLVVRFLF